MTRLTWASLQKTWIYTPNGIFSTHVKQVKFVTYVFAEMCRIGQICDYAHHDHI